MEPAALVAVADLAVVAPAALVAPEAAVLVGPEAVALVAAGRGVSIVPGHTLTAALHAQQVREVRVQGKPATTDTVFHVARSGSFQDPVIGSLLEMVAALQVR